MNFYEKLEKTLLDDYNYNQTENGALGFRETGKKLLDINFFVSSLRGKSEKEILNYFIPAFFEDKILAVKWLFFARDIRGGLGERNLFKTCIKYLASANINYIKPLLGIISEYGRWDDMFILLDTSIKNDVLNLIRVQLAQDIDGMNAKSSISLLAKWMPSINASSEETKKLARIFIKSFKFSEKEYRKTLAELRSYLKIVEKDMSAQNWKEINYEAVPSKANLIYNNAFLKQDEDRRRQYLSALEKGEKKINAETLYPYEIVHKYGVNTYYKTPKDITLEELWKALPNTVKNSENTIVVADGSGSMEATIPGTNVSNLSIANSLAIYFAERAEGIFKNKYITFSERPQLVNFDNCKTLLDKISVALQHHEVANTNVKAVFELILTTAVRNKTPQEEMPKNILILSDMEFDDCGGRYLNIRLFEAIKAQYEQKGYNLPRLIFWNLGSRTKTIPVIENDLGVVLVSGFSANTFKMVLKNQIDPYECLLDTLNSERYEPIGTLLKEATA